MTTFVSACYDFFYYICGGCSRSHPLALQKKKIFTITNKKRYLLLHMRRVLSLSHPLALKTHEHKNNPENARHWKLNTKQSMCVCVCVCVCVFVIYT